MNTSIYTWIANNGLPDSETNGPYVVAFQTDGNLCIYSSKDSSYRNALFSTKSSKISGPYTFELSNDGILRIYNTTVIIFNSSKTTIGSQLSPYDNPPSFITVDYDLSTTGIDKFTCAPTLIRNIVILKNGYYSLVLQDDGNLVVSKYTQKYNERTPNAGPPVWALNSGDPNKDKNAPYVASLQSDGNVCIYSAYDNSKTVPLFSTKSDAIGFEGAPYTFDLSNTGVFKIYNKDLVIFNSSTTTIGSRTNNP